MTTMFLAFLKVSFILSLVGIFLVLFGIPSLEQYLNQGIFVEISTDTSPDGLVNAPAVTLCPENPDTAVGWKSGSNVSLAVKSVYDTACSRLNGEKLINCVNNFTYSLDEIMVSKLKNKKDNVSSDITWAHHGMCHTFMKSDRIGSQTTTTHRDYPRFNSKLKYQVFIHDPDFFFPTRNPKAHPGFFVSLPKSEEASNLMYIQNMEIIEHRNINLKKNPCIENPEYSFSACLKDAVIRSVGCRLPWSSTTAMLDGRKVDNCSTLKDFRSHSSFYHKIFSSEQKDVVKLTNCTIPCNFRAINAVGEPMITKMGNKGGFLIFSLNLVSTDIRVETQALVYTFTSLIANFGGALGLFLGFSFYMLWEWIIYVSLIFHKRSDIF